MKGLMIPLLVLVIVLGSVACGGTESPAGTPGQTPTPGVTPLTPGSIADAIEVLGMLPLEWQGARYINLAEFREDPNLNSFYKECRQQVGQDLAGLGIDLNEVDYAGFVGGHAAIYHGSIDLNRMRQVLEGANYDKSAYLGVEIWESSNPEKGVVVLLPPETVLVTKEHQEAELYISVIKGWGSSIYDDEDVNDVIARLPQKPLRVEVSLVGDSGPLATGSSVEKIASDTLEMMRLSKFRDDASAESGLSDMTVQFGTWAGAWNMVDVETVQLRRYVKSTGSANIEDVPNPLGYWTYWLH